MPGLFLQGLAVVLVVEAVMASSVGSLQSGKSSLVSKREAAYASPVVKRSACSFKSVFSGSEIQLMLAAHNDVRRNANPTPYIQLVDLTWDEGLASRAQELADSCRFSHDVLKDCSDKKMGQNLAYHGSFSYTMQHDLTRHVTSWASEVEDYNLESNTCTEGKACGHYTQIVWDETTKVGCGYKKCNKLYNKDYSLQTDFGAAGNAWLMVCDYSPTGNWVGEKPYETEYIELVDVSGSACTEWISQYCNNEQYGRWAQGECALTCSQTA